MCLSFPEQRDPGSCPETRSPHFVPRNCGTPFYTQNLSFQKTAVILLALALFLLCLSKVPLYLLITWEHQLLHSWHRKPLCRMPAESDVLSMLCPLGRPEGISVYFGAVGMSKKAIEVREEMQCPASLRPLGPLLLMFLLSRCSEGPKRL